MKYLRIILCLLIAISAQAKTYKFNETHSLIEKNSHSPIMSYKLRANIVNNLNDSALYVFAKPSQYAEDRFTLLCKDYNSLLDIYRDFPNSASLNYEYIENAEILYKSKHYLSLRFTTYMYTGGAHGNTLIDQWIIDRKSREVLTFEDIFISESEKDLKVLNDKYLQMAFPGQNIKEILFNKEYQVSHDIYLDRKGVIFQYDPYEIAAYVYGSIEILVPYNELKPLLKIKL